MKTMKTLLTFSTNYITVFIGKNNVLLWKRFDGIPEGIEYVCQISEIYNFMAMRDHSLNASVEVIMVKYL